MYTAARPNGVEGRGEEAHRGDVTLHTVRRLNTKHTRWVSLKFFVFFFLFCKRVLVLRDVKCLFIVG